MSNLDKNATLEVKRLKRLSNTETVYDRYKRRVIENTQFTVGLCVFVPLIITHYTYCKVFRKDYYKDNSK